MKKWENPAVEELNVSCTEQGKSFTPYKDAERVDPDGNKWYSFSGASE